MAVSAPDKDVDPRNACCSFCCKSYTDVGPLVEGPGQVYICGECIELCQSIIDQEKRRRQPPRQLVEAAAIRDKLNQFVSGQDEAKQALALAAAARAEGECRVLLIGSSRSAGILFARALAHVLEAPFASGDGSGLVRSLPDSSEEWPLLLGLLEASDFDLEKARRGVVLVDGADRPDVQQALLRLWQENVGHPVAGLQLAVARILFVCGGVFAGLEEAIRRSGRHVEQPVRIEDLIAVGVRPDWAERLTGVARVGPLGEEDLVRLVQWVDFRRGEAPPAQPGAAADRSAGDTKD